MFKKKEWLLFCLALNSVTGLSYSDENLSDNKQNNLYQNMKKNIDKERSNKGNYKLIEKILKNKNNELQDLYLQNDFVIMPEFLEWQIYFTGFSSNSNRGGTKEKITSYTPGEIKSLDLGMVIPVKGTSRAELSLNVSPVTAPDITLNVPAVTLNTPSIVIPATSTFGIPKNLNVQSQGSRMFSLFTPPSAGQATDTIAYNTSGSKIYENLNVKADTSVDILMNDNSTTITGNTVYNNNAYAGTTSGSTVHTGTGSRSAVHNIGLDGNFSIENDWNVNVDSTVKGTGKGFLAYRPYYITNDGSTKFTGNLSLTSSNTSDQLWGYLTGLSLSLIHDTGIQSTATLENTGTITTGTTGKATSGTTLIGMYLAPTNTLTYVNGKLINSGKIILQNNSSGPNTDNSKSIGIQAEIGSSTPNAEIRIGNIDVNDDNGLGVGIRYNNTSESNNLKLDGSGGQVTLNNKNAVGIMLENINSKSISDVSNLNILLNNNFQTALQIATTSNSEKAVNLDSNVIENIETSDASKYTSLILHTGSGELILDESLKDVLKIEKGSGGQMIVNNGSGLLKNYMPVTIPNTAYSSIALMNSNGTLENYADIVNNSKNILLSTYSIGIQNFLGNTINNANVTLNTTSGIGILTTRGTYTNKSGNINVTGNNSVGLASSFYYTDEPVIDFLSGDINVTGNNAVALYSKRGNINLGSENNIININLSGKDSLLFYNTPDYEGKTLTANIKGNVNANVKNGAAAFYYNGSGITSGVPDLKTFVSTIVKRDNGTFNINVSDDAYRFTIANSGMNISTLNDFTSPEFNFTGSNNSKLYKTNLEIDMDSDLDVNTSTGNKAYRNIDISNSNIKLNSGVTISGTENNQVAISQNADLTTALDLINEGTIKLSGENSAAIGGIHVNITNKGLIDLSASKGGTGIYAKIINTSGNLLNSSGEIKIGDNGIGIYGETSKYLASSNTKIINSGKITGMGDNGAGIYAKNQHSSSTVDVTLNSGSNINMSAGKGSVGLYSVGANIQGTDAGTITVGDNGVAIYAKDGSVNLENLTLNLYGDNSVGVYTDGTADFNVSNGTNTINIDGKDIIAFNLKSSGTFNNNFVINSTAGSSYVLANLHNTDFYSDSNVNIGGGGTFVNGSNSIVLLDENSVLSSYNAQTGNYNSNAVAAALDGKTSKAFPAVAGGKTVDHEATNNGLIDFGNDSVGLYTINGASSLNAGTINVGDNSAALYGVGTGTGILNKGNINIKNSSVGMLLKNGDNSENHGTISGTGSNLTGMYSDSENLTTLSNHGNIKLTGNNTVSVYLSGNGAQTFDNHGIITVGESADIKSPNIGVYNNTKSGTVNNINKISSGNNSIGIYNLNGSVSQRANGSIETGSNSVGIYSDGGTVNLEGTINMNGVNGIGIYGINNADIINNSSISAVDGNTGIILNSQAKLLNKSAQHLNNNSIFVYSDNAFEITNESGADIMMSGSDNIGFYMENGGKITNNADINGKAGLSNIGIYNSGGEILNKGNISIGDSKITDAQNPYLNSYSVGIYGENTTGILNSGNIHIGANAVGIYSKDSTSEVLNTGNISSSSEGALGMYAENSTVRNEGNITLSGDKSIGIAASKNVTVFNAGTINMNGSESIGIYANINSKVINENSGIININGNNSTGVQLSNNSTLENYGQINIAGNIEGSKDVVTDTDSKSLPSIINAGVIKVDEKFELNGINLTIKVDPRTIKAPTMEELEVNDYALEDIKGGFLATTAVNITAPSFNFTSAPVNIDPLFSQGTNARVYKFENVFDTNTPGGGANTGTLSLKSGSLTFSATPAVNENGGVDVWMEKIDYNNFTQGAWYNSFAENIEAKYLNAAGDSLKLYDKLDLITEESDLQNTFDQLAGSMYANINQREQNIGEVFNNALNIVQNSDNNTKENIKINVIAGKGSSKEDTSGVNSYDYDVFGVLGYRGVDRTYKHSFGYSLGYTRTEFKMDDSDNKDTANTLQLGLHNKYSTNGWNFKNDLLGRVSFHNTDRNINWADGSKSELNSDYNVYGVALINEIGKELSITKNLKIVPYSGLELGYMMHDSFEEKGGIESLKVDSNNAYSIKPNIGVRLDAEKKLGTNSGWKLKGNIGVGYEYELGNMNKQEKASLTALENDSHNLAQPVEDKGKLKTNGAIGVELNDRYGVYVNGEYSAGNKDKEDYKVGLTFKASF
jgi:uncharacterized protein with beta-barrel porin domain